MSLDERLLAQKREPNPRQLMQLQQQQGGAAATAGGSRAICSVHQASLEVWVREWGLSLIHISEPTRPY